MDHCDYHLSDHKLGTQNKSTENQDEVDRKATNAINIDVEF
jgi:hypothetical protein